MTNMLSGFDVSCLVGHLRSYIAIQRRFWSPLWQAGKQYRAMEDLASLVLSFAWLLSMHAESLVEQVRQVAKLPNAPQSMIKTGEYILRDSSRKSVEKRCLCELELDADVDLVAVTCFVHWITWLYVEFCPCNCAGRAML